MKKLHFDDLSKQKYWILLLVMSLVLVLSGFFKPFDFENPKVYQYFSIVGFLVQVLFFSRLFWYKNNVQWNKKGVVLRIKPYFGKSIRFEEVKAVELHENTMTIRKWDGPDVSIDLSEIIQSDRKMLLQLLQQHIE